MESVADAHRVRLLRLSRRLLLLSEFEPSP
jgi:hypothetical protein